MLHRDVSGRILKCAITAHRAIGPGYPETMYQAALELEFKAEGLRFFREAPISVIYRERVIGEFRADFIVEDLFVVELNALSGLGPAEVRQLLNYLRTSEVELGLLINFGTDRIQVERKIFTNDRKPWMKGESMPDDGSGVPQLGGIRRSMNRNEVPPSPLDDQDEKKRA